MRAEFYFKSSSCCLLGVFWWVNKTWGSVGLVSWSDVTLSSSLLSRLTFSFMGIMFHSFQWFLNPCWASQPPVVRVKIPVPWPWGMSVGSVSPSWGLALWWFWWAAGAENNDVSFLIVSSLYLEGPQNAFFLGKGVEISINKQKFYHFCILSLSKLSFMLFTHALDRGFFLEKFSFEAEQAFWEF